ncbi:MAG: class I SAM-dependent methyltransferase [Acidobacteriota bacterium]|nr:MAG: class I SAM-dependent methyltransferase [Acidobacteriota bacterium]
MKNEKYIPALSYDWLTPFYDTVVRFTTRDEVFKRALVEQASIEASHRVLDLACGTATLTILLKQDQPRAEVVGIDGDEKILAIAKTKARSAGVEIRFDEGMSFDLPYANESFDKVISSLFFHHLSRENKVKTLGEVSRILKPNGEFHVADWGLPANAAMKISSRFIQFLDGFETTADSFGGLLPDLLETAGFAGIRETNSFNTLFGTVRLHKSTKEINRRLQ